MFCRCRERVRRRAQHADVPGVPRVSRRPAGAEPRGDRGDDQARSRARLRDRRPRGLPPQELLLPRQPEGVPDLASTTSRSASSGHLRVPTPSTATSRSGSSARTSRRTRRRTCTSPRRAGSTAPPRRSSTSTAAARRSSRSSPQPDLHSADDAKRFLQLLRQTVVELGLSDAELEKGSMRFDVNVSVRPTGSDELRTRTELKNMNSFNFAAKGIETRDRTADRHLRVGRDGRAGDAALRPGATRTRRRFARRRRRRTTATSRSPTSCRCSRRPSSSSGCAARSASCRARASGASPRRCRSTTPTCSSPAGSTGCGRPSSTPAPTRRRRRTCSRTRSSPPASTRRASTPHELAKLVAARAEIPRAAFDEALAHVRRRRLQRRAVPRTEGRQRRRPSSIR